MKLIVTTFILFGSVLAQAQGYTRTLAPYVCLFTLNTNSYSQIIYAENAEKAVDVIVAKSVRYMAGSREAYAYVTTDSGVRGPFNSVECSTSVYGSRAKVQDSAKAKFEN